jgi:hypothetical protein
MKASASVINISGWQNEEKWRKLWRGAGGRRNRVLNALSAMKINNQWHGVAKMAWQRRNVV